MEGSSILIGLTVACIVIILYYRNQRSKLPLPPGPKKQWVVGNLFDVPSVAGWNQYHEWSKQHGEFYLGQLQALFTDTHPDSDIIHLDVLGTNMIILDSYKAAMDLFDKRGTIYSGRSVEWHLRLSMSHISVQVSNGYGN